MPLRGVKLLRSEILLRRVLDECVCRPGKRFVLIGLTQHCGKL